MDELAYIMHVTGESDEVLLSFLLQQAEQMILSETNRTELPPQLKAVKSSLTLFLYNNQEKIGEKSRSEGGVSITYADDMPEWIKKTIQNYRLVRIGGYAFNKK